MSALAIHKYLLTIEDVQHVPLPIGVRVLCVREQDNAPALYALVDWDEARTEPREVVTYGTGFVGVDPSLAYAGTVGLYDGKLVLHVFVREA